MTISKSYAIFVQNYNIIHMFGTSTLYHSCSCFGARHLHLPQHLSNSVVYNAPKWRWSVALPCCISSLLLFFYCCTCIVSLKTLHAPSGFTVVIFSAILKWTLNGLSLGSIIVCLVISLKIGKFRRTRCQCCTYVVVHSYSGFVALEHTWSKESWSSFTISRFTTENDDADTWR